MKNTNDVYPTALFIKSGSSFVRIMGEFQLGTDGKPIWTGALISGKGYIYKNHVWVYRNDITTAPYPIAYRSPSSNDLKLQLIKPLDIDEFKNWEISKIVGNSFEDARTVSADRIILSPDVIEAMNNATSSYKPTIQEGDDFLKRIVKTAIRTKNVDLNRLKAKMAKSYGLSNLKSALKGTTKMSVNGFRTWMVLLGLDFNITVVSTTDAKDAGGRLVLIYSSDTDVVTDQHGAERIPSNPNEDYLKRIVRLLLAGKDVESSTLKSKMSKAYGFSNLVQALTGSTKMSVNGFLTWLDLLDATAEFMVYDNGLDRLNPLPENIYYSTLIDKITDKDGKEIIIHEDEDDESDD